MIGKRIVIVDDDEFIRRTFFLILNKKYRVYLAADADEALAQFKVPDIDLIIVDYKLPRFTGIEFIRKFRESGYRGQAILISAFPDLVGADEIQKLAIDRFFVKPLDLNAFTKSIDCLLGADNVLEKRA